MNTDSVAFLNGAYLPLSEAQVSVLDRGFLLGDGVYEVIPVYGAHPFRLAQHLARLSRSLQAVQIPDPYEAARWHEVIGGLIERNGGGDQSVYLQITRGAAQKRDHGFPAEVRPTVFLMSSPLTALEARLLQDGAAAITLPDQRWLRCDIKAIALLANVLARQQALDAGAMEAILIRDGQVTEGAASNIFVVHNDVVITPPNGAQLLPGVTRDLILELAQGLGVATAERTIPVAQLQQAQEVWLTSSRNEVLAITRLDGSPVGDGRPGAVWRRVYDAYQDYKAHLRSTPADAT